MKKGIACILALMLLLTGTAFAAEEPVPTPTPYPNPLNLKEGGRTKVIFMAKIDEYTWTIPDTLRYMELTNRTGKNGDKITNITSEDEWEKLHEWGDISVGGELKDGGLFVGVSSKRDFVLKNAAPITKKVENLDVTEDVALLDQEYPYDLYTRAVTVGEEDETLAAPVLINEEANLLPSAATAALLGEEYDGKLEIYKIALLTPDEENKVDMTGRVYYTINRALIRNAIGDYKDTLTFYVKKVDEGFDLQTEPVPEP